MRYGEATETVTFKCEGCGFRFLATAMYANCAAAGVRYVCTCSEPCFRVAQRFYRTLIAHD